MTKKEIRNTYKQKRLALSDDKRMQLHEELMKQMSDMELPPAKIILSYHPILNLGEINIRLIDLIIQFKNPAVQFVYPKLINDRGSMEAVLESHSAKYELNKWSITEAVNAQIIDPLKIDIIFLPLLAMDRFGYRVGYGKGYYDRFVKRCNPHVYTIGFSYFEPIDKITDTDSFDVPLHAGVTPYHIYEF